MFASAISALLTSGVPGFSPHPCLLWLQLGGQWVSSILTVCAWVNADPAGWGLSPRRSSTSDTSGKSRLSPALLTHWPWSWGVCLFRFDNLLKRLTELRENSLLAITGILWRLHLRNTQVEEMNRGRFVGRGGEHPCPVWVAHIPNTSTYLPTRKLSLSPWLRVHRGQSAAPLPFPEVLSGAESSNPLITWCFWWPASSRGYLGTLPVSPH